MADSLVHALASDTQILAFQSFEHAEELCLLGAEWVQKAGILLQISQRCVYTALVLFRRYGTLCPPRAVDLNICVMACVSLGSKATETEVSSQDLCNVGIYLKEQFLNPGKDYQVHDLFSTEMYTTKGKINDMELEILRVIDFDTHTVIPHKLAIHYLQTLGLMNDKRLTQCTWSFLNDSLHTLLCVSVLPFGIAVGCIALACRVLNRKLPQGWYQVFDGSEEDIKITKNLLENFYKTSDSLHNKTRSLFTAPS
ncbi:cyclin L family cyclin [Schizosaccharomyces cryophilus OY26]|uniref:Cyclin L family cyclin n=1 Tax=Schizosaccharomyces cryophilus (strain OY26 / ATCC MYA-4695 / CBS 11777 / NBRC 106824 / NRRL Y48691) TaxID=653667 RepID=S9W231_SCHCR|nr:cyclin L family cyclin [Schizosaccharomyces cryophilus OY26]EPY54103.1 cyclin L family cyclin [Schizosaccharomyces cryophilus OY26]